MSRTYAYIADLNDRIEIPSEGILSRTLFQDADVKLVLFGFSAGQELSEHTASRPAAILVLRGTARLLLGEDQVQAGPGAWIHMPAGLRHAVRAESPLAMLLVLMSPAAPAPAAAQRD